MQKTERAWLGEYTAYGITGNFNRWWFGGETLWQEDDGADVLAPQ